MTNYNMTAPTSGASRGAAPTDYDLWADAVANFADIPPRFVSIIAATPPVVSVNWDSFTASAGGYLLGFRRFTSGAQNDEIAWDVNLDAGTWSLTLLHEADPNRGIYSIRLGGVEVGTIDGYNASATNTISTVTGITVASAGRVRLGLKMATKNASAASFFGSISAVTMGRTGA